MRIAVPERIDPAAELGRIHFVGVGGAGLSAIARIMAQRGLSVSGSDANDSALLRHLAEEGVDARAGHDPARLTDVDTVIASTAVPEDNPEIRHALEAGLRVWPRSAGLQSVLLGRRVLAVAGTHGKTTTTSMLALALRESGRDVSFAIGAEVASLASNAHDGSDELFVVEADESDGAFLVYDPVGAVVTNVDADHLDQWGSEAAYREAFATFAGNVTEFLVVTADDDSAVALVRDGVRPGVRVRTAGFAPSADVRGRSLRVDGAKTSVDVLVDREPVGTLTLQVPGRHYVADALLAVAAGLEAGATFDRLAAGIAAYTGAQRRMQPIGEAAGVRVYDSYAHHPAEIVADLQAARSLAPQGRVIAAFQPHLASRTRVFGERMGRALGAADIVAVTDIYLAREDADPAVSRELVLRAVDGPQVLEASTLEDLPGALAAVARRGDVVVTLGAGDITTVAPLLVQRLISR